MKEYTLLVCFFLIQISNAQNLTNTGFENWAYDSTGYLNPVDWLTSNDQDMGVATVVRASGRLSGYSAQLLPVFYDGEYFGGSLMYLIAGNYRPKVLSGYWKGTLLADEYLIAGVSVYNSTYDHLAYGITYDSVSIPDWIPFHVNIDSIFPGVAALTQIDIFLGANSTSCMGFVDDVALTYSTDIGEVQTMMLSSNLSCEPGLGQCSINFDLNNSTQLEISLVSPEGKVIFNSVHEFRSGHYEIPVVMSDLSHGIYFCQITGEGINKVYKLIR